MTTELKCPKCGGVGVRGSTGRGQCKKCNYGGVLYMFDQTGMAARLKELQSQNRSLEQENKRLSAESSDVAALRQMIGTIGSRIITPDSPAWLLPKPSGKGTVHGIPTLMLSDLHWGEVVFPKQVNNINSYNVTIAKKRLARVVEGSVRLLRETLSPGLFGGMVVILGGDMVDGAIHDELRETGELTVIESVISVHDALVPHLYALADEFGRLHVPCVAGNHGRLDKKPRIKQRQKLNFDWMLYQFLARTIAESKYKDKITFQIPDGDDASYRIYNTGYLLTHGDKFTGGNGICGPILPWMRGDMKTRKQYGAMGQSYDWMAMGHWHQLRYLDGIIVNGCLPGFNEYAMRMGFGCEPAQQALWLTHPVRGLTFREAIWADEPLNKTSREPWVSVSK